MSRVRAWLLGGRSGFTTTVLEALLEAGVEIEGLAVPAAKAAAAGAIPVSITEPVAARIAATGGRFVTVRAEDPAALPADLRAPVAVVACFPRRIPAPWLARFPGGVYNIHPSALPRHRGPTPVFWQMRAGLTRFGVTVHRVIAALDAGPVVASGAVEAGPGALAERVELRLAWAGAELAAGVLADAAHGRAPPGEAQNEARASYQSWPDEAAFRLDTSWPVRRAFGFMAGTAGWRRRYRVDAAGGTLEVRSVLGFDEGASSPGAWTEHDGRLRIEFDGGTLEARGSAL